jgi:hypothetical protein
MAGSQLFASFVGSVLSHSLNTVYAVRYAHPNCAFGTTSHTPKPLSEMTDKYTRRNGYDEE